MNFFWKLWNWLDEAFEEFVADLLGEDTLAPSKTDSQQVAGMVETDSFESW